MLEIINPFRFGAGAVALTSDLVSVYEMHDTSGTTCTDSHGSNNGTYVGTPSLDQTGHIDKCVDFNGTSQYVTLPVGARPNGNFTISAWFNADAWDTTYGGIVGGGIAGSATSDGGVTIASFDSLSRFYLDTYTATAREDAYDTSLPSTTTWHLVVAVCDGSEIRLYLDNSSVAFDDSLAGGTTWDYSGVPTWGIAHCFQPFGTRRYFNGKIEQVAIWSEALNEAQRDTLWNSGNGLDYSSWL